MGTAILIILFLALIGGGIYVFVRGRARQKELEHGSGPLGLASGPGSTSAGGGAARPASSGVRTLKPGDVVNYEAKDFIVEGTITFNEDGFVWHEHLIVDADDKRWLSVEDDEGLEVAIWTRLSGATLEPGPGTIEHDGITYRLDERGGATFTAQGSTGTGPSGRAEYADYQSGENRLSFERYGADGGWEISVGHVISEHVLDVYPGRGL